MFYILEKSSQLSELGGGDAFRADVFGKSDFPIGRLYGFASENGGELFDHFFPPQREGQTHHLGKQSPELGGGKIRAPFYAR